MKIAATNKVYDIDGETIVNKAYVGSDLVWLTPPPILVDIASLGVTVFTATEFEITNIEFYQLRNYGFSPAYDDMDGYCTHHDTNDFISSGNSILVGRGSDSGGHSHTYHAFCRLHNPGLRQGIQLTSAHLSVYADATLSGAACNLSISFEDADNPSVPISHADIESRVKTSEINWNNVEPFTTDGYYISPDLASILQPIINRPGFTSSSNINVFIRNNNSDEGAYRSLYAHELDPALYGTIQLHCLVSWEPYFNNTDWTAVRGSWDGSKWDSSDASVDLNPIGVWYQDFRPTQIRVTISGTVLGWVVLNDDNTNVIAEYLENPGSDKTEVTLPTNW
jgi:hypothetical protein